MSNVSLDDLISQGENLLAASHTRTYGSDFVPRKEFEEWKRVADLFLQNNYPGFPQTADFHKLVQEQNHRTYHCESLLAILKAFNSLQPKEKAYIDYHAILINVFEKFHQVAVQLKRRHNGRETLRIEDEYDVQDLLEALLKLFFLMLGRKSGAHPMPVEARGWIFS